jgi:hypothetical protein
MFELKITNQSHKVNGAINLIDIRTNVLYIAQHVRSLGDGHD